MGFQIQDGTGSSRKARVSNSNRLLVDSIVEERAVFNSIDVGKTFIVLTDFLTITGVTGQEDGLIYLKNNSDLNMLIHHIKLWSGTASQLTKISTYKNPTTGTLISSAIAADVENMNFSSSNTYEGLAYQGDGTNLTVTDGDVWGRHYLGIGNQQMLSFMWNGAVVLGKGDSVAVTAEAPNGVSVNLACEIEVYFE
jgi:hypothetical protein